jgi:energy coupling factor transporter S component ThiW
MQRWEAVFRRERKPVSFDRTFRTCSRLVAGTGCFVAGAPVFVLRRRRWLKRSQFIMKNLSVKKLALAGMFCALCVVGSVFSFPMFGSKCAPVQHMVNVLCAVLLGPWWGVGVAFVASLLRNLLGLGSLMAFPGSMFGALICGLIYKKSKNIPLTLVGEVGGTSLLGGLCAYPVAVLLMGKSASDVAFYAYIIPFFISTAVGSIISGIIVFALKKCGVLSKMQNGLK